MSFKSCSQDRRKINYIGWITCWSGLRPLFNICPSPFYHLVCPPDADSVTNRHPEMPFFPKTATQKDQKHPKLPTYLIIEHLDVRKRHLSILKSWSPWTRTSYSKGKRLDKYDDTKKHVSIGYKVHASSRVTINLFYRPLPKCGKASEKEVFSCRAIKKYSNLSLQWWPGGGRSRSTNGHFLPS